MRRVSVSAACQVPESSVKCSEHLIIMLALRVNVAPVSAVVSQRFSITI